MSISVTDMLRRLSSSLCVRRELIQCASPTFCTSSSSDMRPLSLKNYLILRQVRLHLPMFCSIPPNSEPEVGSADHSPFSVTISGRQNKQKPNLRSGTIRTVITSSTSWSCLLAIRAKALGNSSPEKSPRKQMQKEESAIWSQVETFRT